MGHNLKQIKVKRLSSSPYFKENFLKNEKNILEQIPSVHVLPLNSTEESDIIITNTHVKMDLNKIDELKNCKLIIHSNSGYDNYTYDFVKAFPSPIVLGNSIRKHAVANFNISAILNYFTNIPHQKNWDHNRKWQRTLLNELNLQLIGFGEIGQLIHESLRPLLNKIFIYDPDKSKFDLNLNESNIIVLACSLNPTNYHIVNNQFLNQLRNDVLILNTARGELIKFEDLIYFLENNQHSHAIIDVFEQEPTDFSKFSLIQNLNLTSHIAGVFKNIDQITFEFEKKCIEDFLFNKHFISLYQDKLLNNKLRENFLL